MPGKRRVLPLLAPDPRIDGGVEKIGNQASEHNDDDRDRLHQWDVSGEVVEDVLQTR